MPHTVIYACPIWWWLVIKLNSPLPISFQFLPFACCEFAAQRTPEFWPQEAIMACEIWSKGQCMAVSGWMMGHVNVREESFASFRLYIWRRQSLFLLPTLCLSQVVPRRGCAVLDSRPLFDDVWWMLNAMIMGYIISSDVLGNTDFNCSAVCFFLKLWSTAHWSLGVTPVLPGDVD